MKELKTTILGEKWIIKIGSEIDFPYLKSVDGYTDSSVREIIVDSFAGKEMETGVKLDLKQYQNQVLRHEIIHAFLFESGLDANTHQCSEWATNEEMVDWMAIQFPKIKKVYEELGIN